MYRIGWNFPAITPAPLRSIPNKNLNKRIKNTQKWHYTAHIKNMLKKRKNHIHTKIDIKTSILNEKTRKKAFLTGRTRQESFRNNKNIKIHTGKGWKTKNIFDSLILTPPEKSQLINTKIDLKKSNKTK